MNKTHVLLGHAFLYAIIIHGEGIKCCQEKVVSVFSGCHSSVPCAGDNEGGFWELLHFLNSKKLSFVSLCGILFAFT